MLKNEQTLAWEASVCAAVVRDRMDSWPGWERGEPAVSHMGHCRHHSELGKSCSSTIGAGSLTSQLSTLFKIWLPDVAAGSSQLQSQPGVCEPGIFTAPRCPGDDCTAFLLCPAVGQGSSVGLQGWGAAQLHLVR